MTQADLIVEPQGSTPVVARSDLVVVGGGPAGIAAAVSAARNGLSVINAEVPLAEMFGYSTAIRSLSKGRSSYSMEPHAFEQVPEQVKAAVLEQKGK